MVIREVKDNYPVQKDSQATVICEIPIYGSSQNKFNEYWNKQADEYVRKCVAISPDRKDVAELPWVILRTVMWKYNQIVGYIRILLNKNDVYFEEFRSFSQYRRSSKTRPFIQYDSAFHIPIGNKKTNAQIASKIKKYLQLIINEILKNHPNYYVDVSTFSNIIDHLDLMSIIHATEEENPNE
jgi:Zn-finger protein